jgi:hypothetical protein
MPGEAQNVGLHPHLHLPRNNVGHGESWSMMGHYQGKDLWLESSMRPRGFEKRDQHPGQYPKTQSLILPWRIGSKIWGHLFTAPGRWEGTDAGGGDGQNYPFNQHSLSGHRLKSHTPPRTRPVTLENPIVLGLVAAPHVNALLRFCYTMDVP